MARIGCRHLPTLIQAALLLGLGIAFCPGPSGAQASQKGVRGQGDAVEDPLKIKVEVDEVRIDAVVVDNKGKQVSDLTTDDFEVYQDGKRQEITSCRYINQDRSSSVEKQTTEQEALPLIPVPKLKREEVQRSIVVLVNDFSMEFDDVYNTRMALRKYVTEQIQPGDLISIFKTSRGSATLQAFSSDRRELLAKIENIQWSAMFDPSKEYVEYRYEPEQALQNPYPPIDLDNISDPSLVSILEQARNPIKVTRMRWEEKIQLEAVEYCIKALEDMPGRTYILLVTSIGGSGSAGYDRVLDSALRSGVVIHTLNIKGLEVGDVINLERSNSTPRIVKKRKKTDTSFFSKKTGGLDTTGFNFFIDGIGEVNEHMKGYYLLSYIPPPNSFSKSEDRKYHKIKIKVKRRGASVYNRPGFYENPAPMDVSGVSPPPLVEAMFSPFLYNDLNISLASGYIDNLEKGYLLPTWIHLDIQNLGILEEADGNRSVFFKVGASTTDLDGIFQDYGDLDVRFRVSANDIQLLKDSGVNFTVSIPVKKPGGHYVRAALEDQATGAKGSAYQFIDIPDLKKNRLALSSLYIVNGDEDADWIRSMASGGSEKSSGYKSKVAQRNPAYTTFRPGDSFEYMVVIYNAKTRKELPPELESRVALYRDGAEFSGTEFEMVDVDGADDYSRIPFRNTMRIDASMQPGDYVLMLQVRDKQAKDKQNLAARTLGLRVAAP